ncbi:MAG: DUF952 domain-containing protein [Mycobacterium sp.]|nr:DUF952 domain-containing protein [Mycobacterium sp.]
MSASASQLVHICGSAEWAAASSAAEYRPESLDTAGFVHLSTPEQVHLPANRIYAGRTDLVLLYLNPGLLGAPVRWEPGVPTDPRSMLFPHLYGPLPIAAVTNVTSYVPGPDGLFGTPPSPTVSST